MYTKDINARSPLRVFEKSIRGGLGRGNVGVVMSRAGVGKTAFIIGVALDDLMRGRKVLHFGNHETVDHVREFYDEVFKDLAENVHMDDARSTHLLVERSRIIHTYRDAPFTVEKLVADARFYRHHASFQPEVVVIDGFDFENAAETDLTALKDFAKEANVEIWMTALTHRDEPITNAAGIPNPVARFEAWVSVLVNLEPVEGAVRLNLLKDHDNPDVEDLHLLLDPRTLLLQDGK